MPIPPMIAAVGVSTFKGILDEQPDFYNPSYEGNYKPITMEYMWQCYEKNVGFIGEGKIEEEAYLVSQTILENSYKKWKNGLSRKDAVRDAIEAWNRILH